jgi:hypothetical protein
MVTTSAVDRESNNTMATAQNIGTVLFTGDRTTRTLKVEGNASGSDTDFFRFFPGNQATSKITITLTGTNTNFFLYSDTNFNRQIDSGDFIDGTFGRSSKTITLDGSGDNEYYIKVSKSGSAANYKLDITATPGVGRERESNNNPSEAQNIGRLNGFRTFEGSVGSSDRIDYYRFRLDATRSVSVGLSDPSFSTANADLRLYKDANNNGRLESSELVAVSAGTKANESINRRLGSGDYFVEVAQMSGNVNYRLHMSALS